MDAFEVVDIADQRVAVVRRVVPMAELPAFFGEAFHAVAAAVEAGEGSIAGPAFGWYHGMPADTVDVAAGFPVEGWEADAGEVTADTRTGGPAVVTVHVGPYDAMAGTYEALRRWSAEHGLTLAGEMWEEYLGDPATDPATWRTRIVWLLAS